LGASVDGRHLYKARRACWRDAKKARQYIAGRHPVGASCLCGEGIYLWRGDLSPLGCEAAL